MPRQPGDRVCPNCRKVVGQSQWDEHRQVCGQSPPAAVAAAQDAPDNESPLKSCISSELDDAVRQQAVAVAVRSMPPLRTNDILPESNGVDLSATKLKFEMRVCGNNFKVPCYKLEVDTEDQAVAVAREVIKKMKLTRDANGVITVSPMAITAVSLKLVQFFDGNYETIPW